MIEYARNVLGLVDATSGEFDPDAEHQVVVYMPEISQTHLGGTMRLGARRSLLHDRTLAIQIYNGERTIVERHRHRYEVNPDYVARLQDAGLRFSGVDDDEKVRMECVELADASAHPFFFGCQYHPEFLSRPMAPSPPFLAFVQASAGKFVKREVVAKDASASARKNGAVGATGAVAGMGLNVRAPSPSPTAASASPASASSSSSSSSSSSAASAAAPTTGEIKRE